jgi:thioredoxin 1
MENRIHTIKTKEDFKNYLNNYKFIVMKFTASWCGPCKQINPIFENYFMQLPEDFICVIVDVDEGKNLANSLRVKSVPTLMNYINGECKDINVGANEDKLFSFFKKTLEAYNSV